MELKDKVTAVKGVGPKMEEKLGRMGIHTVEDLISYFPRKYQDWTNITPMDALDTEDERGIRAYSGCAGGETQTAALYYNRGTY